MNKYSLLLLVFLVMAGSSCFNQEQNINKMTSSPELPQNNNDKLIAKAAAMIPYDINPDDFIISITIVEGNTEAFFYRPVKFVPRNFCAYYDVKLNVTTDNFRLYSFKSNPEGRKTKDNVEVLYNPATKDRQKIKFVLDALKTDMESFNVNDLTTEDEMVIIEEKRYYQVTLVSPHQESFYKIDKKTGKLYDSGHSHLIPPPAPDM